MIAKKRAKEEGVQEGLKKGMQKGLKEGMQKEKLNIAKNLLLANVDVNIIAQTTNLSVEQIENLRHYYS